MKPIIHQMQPTHNSCVCTCLAMLANLPAQLVVDLYHEEYQADLYGNPIIRILEELHITAVPASTFTKIAYKGFIYLICAQSLNNPQGSHQIIFDCRWSEGYKILDPQMGRKDVKHYVPSYVETSSEETPLAVPLIGGWNIDFRILDCPAMREKPWNT